MKSKLKIVLLLLMDALLVCVSFVLAILLRFEFNLDSSQFASSLEVLISNVLPLILIKLLVFSIHGLYTSLWKYAGSEELIKISFASVFANIAFMVYMMLTNQGLPRSTYIIACLLDAVFIGGTRFAYRYIRAYRYPGYFTIPGVKRRMLGSEKSSRVLLVGGGDAGATIINEIRHQPDDRRRIVGIIDDDVSKHNKSISGVKILGDRYTIPDVVRKYSIDEIIVAIPSAPRKTIADILSICRETKCHVKVMPSLIDLISEKVSVKYLRDVEIEDLLGREPVELDLEAVSGYISNRVVMVTGAGGSIGSELCRQVAKFGPRRIVAVDIYENSVFELGREMNRNFPDISMDIIIASVRDRARMEEVFVKYKPHVVFHAAAHKHVPLMEDSPKEALYNNCLGTQICMDLAQEYLAEKFVLISTDKAVNPTNVMGASKRICEMLMQHKARNVEDAGDGTEFCAVRFGNVLGSNGSVIPIFRRQISEGGPVTVTHRDIVRYFMLIPEAVQLVMQAGALAKGGEIFVLDMGEPVKIMDLAENIIQLSGLEPHKDIEIKITGLRPGEKLYEELLLAEEGVKETEHHMIYVARPIATGEGFECITKKGLEVCLEEIEDMDEIEVRAWIRNVVPTYQG